MINSIYVQDYKYIVTNICKFQENYMIQQHVVLFNKIFGTIVEN